VFKTLEDEELRRQSTKMALLDTILQSIILSIVSNILAQMIAAYQAKVSALISQSFVALIARRPISSPLISCPWPSS